MGWNSFGWWASIDCGVRSCLATTVIAFTFHSRWDVQWDVNQSNVTSRPTLLSLINNVIKWENNRIWKQKKSLTWQQHPQSHSQSVSSHCVSSQQSSTAFDVVIVAYKQSHIPTVCSLRHSWIKITYLLSWTFRSFLHEPLMQLYEHIFVYENNLYYLIMPPEF